LWDFISHVIAWKLKMTVEDGVDFGALISDLQRIGDFLERQKKAQKEGREGDYLI
jgi:hypothetical protein